MLFDVIIDLAVITIAVWCIVSLVQAAHAEDKYKEENENNSYPWGH